MPENRIARPYQPRVRRWAIIEYKMAGTFKHHVAVETKELEEFEKQLSPEVKDPRVTCYVSATGIHAARKALEMWALLSAGHVREVKRG